MTVPVRVLAKITCWLGLGFAAGGVATWLATSEIPFKLRVYRTRLAIVALFRGELFHPEPDFNSGNRELFAYGFTPRIATDWQAVDSPGQPQWRVRPGFAVALVADGLDAPVNLVFVPEPGPDPDSPVLYVNELHGVVKALGRDGRLRRYAEGLINFEPIPMPKSDEMGLSGLARVPGSEDLLVTGSVRDPVSGLLKNRILRLHSEPGGKRMAALEVVRTFDEFTSPSNQIQQIAVGPDHKLYVAVGDAENHLLSQDPNRFGGKILRLNLDGTACDDNPFFEPTAPEAPRSAVLALGFRNVFDFAFDAGGQLWAVDNGKNLDRLCRVQRGASYGWNGDPESIRTNALYTWGPIRNPAPTGLEILQNDALGPGTAGRGYVAMYGPPAASGPNHAKSIVEIGLDPATGTITRAPTPLIQYQGPRRATVLGLAEGPDGLYFTDFWGESEHGDSPRGRIYKVVRAPETLAIAPADPDRLATLSPVARGQFAFRQNCSACHTLDGDGGHEGPELTHVRSNLDHRLNVRGYDAQLDALLRSDATFIAAQRPRLEAVRQARGDDRLRTWLVHHLEEPRFDHPFARMPSFAEALTDAMRLEIIEFLMTRR